MYILRSLGVLDSEKAVMWSNEKFTRLIVGKYEITNPKLMHFVVGYEPLKWEYCSRQEFKHIVFPVVQEEWKFVSSKYAEENTVSGVLQNCFFVELYANEDTGESWTSRILQVRVETGKFWNQKKAIHVRKVTVTLQCLIEVLN